MRPTDIVNDAKLIRRALRFVQDLLSQSPEARDEEDVEEGLARLHRALDLNLMADNPYDQDGKWSHVKNLSMRRELELDEAIDISGCGRMENGFYILAYFEVGKDYCDAREGHWVQWIGRHHRTGLIYASTNGTFYLNPLFETLFLR